MNKIKSLFLLLFAVILAGGCSPANERPVEHVVLISLDGSRPAFYMDSSWPAPHLQKLKQQGVYASKGAKSVFPSVTYPSHTSIITGAYPGNHGIYYNTPINGSPGEWYWNANAIKTRTLWEAVKEAGLTSGAVFWPVTVDAPIDYNFPVRRPEKGEKGNKLTIKYPYITPKGLLEKIEKKTGQQFTASNLATKNYAQSKTIATIANYIIKTYKPNFMAVHFVGIDHAEHQNGTDGPKVRKMVQVTDSLVGTVIQTIKDSGIWNNTAVIITGDHGHINTKATFAPNVYLAGHGLITEDGWKAKFHGVGGTAYLYLKSKKDQETLDSVVSILKNTPEYKKGIFRILKGDTLDELGVNPNVSLVLATKAGVTVRSGTKGQTLKHRKNVGSTHGYDPAYPAMHTTFITIGTGISGHKDITRLELVDIAPLVARLLGLDFKAPDGELQSGILKED